MGIKGNPQLNRAVDTDVVVAEVQLPGHCAPTLESTGPNELV